MNLVVLLVIMQGASSINGGMENGGEGIMTMLTMRVGESNNNGIYLVCINKG